MVVANLLCHGNNKLGHELIYSFGLPSGDPKVCVGKTAACEEVCYGKRVETYRASVRRRYERNLAASRKQSFAARVVSEIKRRFIRVVRWNVGGDIYSATFARKLAQIARGTEWCRHYVYSRSWRVPSVRVALEELAAVKNFRVWYSLDRDTGLPEGPVHPRVRLCYLQLEEHDLPPVGTGLVFRVRKLRSKPAVKVGEIPICPVETPTGKAKQASCQSCMICFKTLAEDLPTGWKNGRLALGSVPW